jgi:uncharacterized protein YaeQ
MAKSFEVKIEKPGLLIYKEGNYEYTFPSYEQDGEIVVVDFPTRRRVYLFFGWFTIPRKHPLDEKEKIRSRLLAYFDKAGKRVRFFDRGNKDEQPFAFNPELFEQRGVG